MGARVSADYETIIRGWTIWVTFFKEAVHNTPFQDSFGNGPTIVGRWTR